MKRVISNAIAALLFGRLTSLYDAWTWVISLGRWRAWQLTAVSHVQGPRILELGCGPGHLVAAIAATGSACCALDNSIGMLKQARKNTAREDTTVSLVRGLAQELPFTSGSFDTAILCFSGLAWLPQVLAECRRILSPSGLLLVVDEVSPARGSVRAAFVRRALSLFDCDDGSVRHETPLREAGFDVSVADERVDGDVVRLLLGRRLAGAA